jgi:hypothetical protein
MKMQLFNCGGFTVYNSSLDLGDFASSRLQICGRGDVYNIVHFT